MRIEPFIVCAALTLAGCDAVNGKAETPAVLVTVNANDITTAGIERVLPATAARPDRKEAQAAIESLIDEELLVQEALASGLDSDPAVAASRAQASRQALARLAAERIVATIPPVDPATVHDYYAAHPDWYAQRKLFQFVVFVVDRRSTSTDLQGELDSAHSPERIRAILEARGIPFRTQPLTATAEDLPQAKLPDFSSSSPGDLLVTTHGFETYLLSVSSVTAAPLDFPAAKPAIEKRLDEERRREVLDRYLKEQREAATISYHAEALDPYLATLDLQLPPEHGSGLPPALTSGGNP